MKEEMVDMLPAEVIEEWNEIVREVTKGATELN